MLLAQQIGLPWGFWQFITRFGEAQLLLPTALVLGAWFATAGARRAAFLWFALFGTAFALTTASKIAFIGWGVGIPRLNLTGISGHAMHAAAVYPLLLRCLASAGPRGLRAAAVAFAFALAATVALSRVVIGAHSASESVAGFALGAAASALTLALAALPSQPLPRWLLALLVAALLLNPTAAPSLRTHDLVTRVALAVSGHERPYTRQMLRQRGDCWVPDWTTTGPKDPGRSCS
jgi:membrane-associated phospholipid phosphatase